MKEVLLLILAAATGGADHGLPARWHELSVANISLGQTETSVTDLLGSPQARTYNEALALPIVLSYDGLEVHLDEQGVGGIISTSKQFCTPSMVCPGVTTDQVQSTYGFTGSRSDGDRTVWQYFIDDGCWLELASSNNIVASVAVQCSP